MQVIRDPVDKGMLKRHEPIERLVQLYMRVIGFHVHPIIGIVKITAAPCGVMGMLLGQRQKVACN